MSIEIVTFRVTGISALLMHNPASMQRADGKPKPKQIPTPEEEAERGTYRLPSGQLYVKAIAFRSAMLNGCKGQKAGKVGAGTVLSGAVFNLETECPLVHPKTGEELHEYEINTTRAVIQKQGVLRSRPQINEWACDVAFEIDTDFIAVEIVEAMFQRGGKMAGVGDWRPEKRGVYGRFTVELTS